MSSQFLDAESRTVLALVHQGRGGFGARELAQRLPSGTAAPRVALADTLAELLARRLVVRVSDQWGERWAATAQGVVALHSAGLTPALPASDDERQAWVAALGGSFVDLVRFIGPRMIDPAAVEAALLELSADETLARGVAMAVMALPESSRARVLPIVAGDPSAPVRRALFAEFPPRDLEVPRVGAALLPEPAWTDLLRQALGDQDRAVRASAAALVFDTGIGAALVLELLANLDEPHADLRAGALLALGGSRDPVSLARLRAAVQDDNPALAAAAVRALAARPDGRGDWRAALADGRVPVRDAALFALARVLDGLDAAELAALEDPAQPAELRAAARAYRARAARPDA